MQIDASQIRFAGETGSNPNTDAPTNVIMTVEIVFDELPQNGIQYLGVGFYSGEEFEVGFD